jgi:hypothetical protein
MKTLADGQNLIEGLEGLKNKTMEIYLDSEFTNLHQKTTLISIGIVAATGETFYAEAIDYDRKQINEWLRKNVMKNLFLHKRSAPKSTDDHTRVRDISDRISVELFLWLKRLAEKHDIDKFEIWSDVYAYDWMLFCELYGGALYIPDNIYYIPFDLATEMKLKNVDPDISREEFAELDGFEGDKHNCLWDAKVIKACHEKLRRK